ncbi:MAG: aspartate kinase [Planctomycetes bacterium]|nr:aspartate kinase [Planctomycetota bacterium]
MLVLKFGGTSVGDAERIRTVADLVRQALPKRPVVVASAHKGVTDMLFRMGQEALHGKINLEPLRERHLKIIRDLGVPETVMENLLDELANLLQGISMVKELTPRTKDYVASFGERLSVRTIAAYLAQAGIPAKAVDAFDLGLITDSNFGAANPLPEADQIMHWNIRRIEGVPVITGYVGKDKNGDITTLGRNGSDYSATIIGAAIGAEEVQIWTDVDGVMTTDPDIVPHARPLDQMSFAEAGELAYYGGRVLHPSTLIPAIRKDIPVRVLNTFKPESKGTVILRQTPIKQVVKSIGYKDDLFLITIVSTRMLMHYGFMAKIFEIFGRHRIVIDMIATSEVSVSLTTDSDVNLDQAVKELSQIAEVTVEPGKAIICVVGEGIKRSLEVPSLVFGALRERNIKVQMISQGSTQVNLALLVDSANVVDAVQALHDSFFDVQKPVIPALP